MAFSTLTLLTYSFLNNYQTITGVVDIRSKMADVKGSPACEGTVCREWQKSSN
jgi:hypothetical protein